MRLLLLLLACVMAVGTNGADDRQSSYELRHSFPRGGKRGSWETDTTTNIDSKPGSIYFEPLIEPNELTKPKQLDYLFNHGTKKPDYGVGMTNEFINGSWTYLEPVAEVSPEPSSWLLLLTGMDRAVMAGGMAICFLGLVLCALEWVTWRRRLNNEL